MSYLRNRQRSLILGHLAWSRAVLTCRRRKRHRQDSVIYTTDPKNQLFDQNLNRHFCFTLTQKVEKREQKQNFSFQLKIRTTHDSEHSEANNASYNTK